MRRRMQKRMKRVGLNVMRRMKMMMMRRRVGSNAVVFSVGAIAHVYFVEHDVFVRQP
jgi:hypothetical protein